MEDGYVVYVVNSAQAKRCEVELGTIKQDKVQVISGLELGDKLIISGHRFVVPGQKVNIIPEDK
jgi:multidrug efflux pump subunit AcrA (membrane-fusion protein)